MNLSILCPSRLNNAGSMVTDKTAANPTALIAPYATDFKNACGNTNNPDRATATMAAENTTVLPAVPVARLTAVRTSCPPPRLSSSRNRDTINSP